VSQVEARQRCRSKKIGFGIVAACLSVAISAGGNCDLPEPLGQPVRLTGSHATDARQVRPLIFMRLERCEVEEDGGADSPALSL
jgi:hypothetical protein